MRIIGVIDLRAGRAVHAVAGARERYRPVQRVGDTAIDGGDPVAVAHAYRRLGIDELYVADLDAIQKDPLQATALAAIAGLGAPMWLDAGITTPAQAEAALATGATGVVIGLETLPSFDLVREVCADAGGACVAFSLDLHQGEPLMAPAAALPEEGIDALAGQAVAAGAGTLIVLDLARIGMGTGPDLAIIGRVRAAAPEAALLAGGGVRGTADLEALAAAGCDGVLIATAIHDGRLGAAEVAAAQDQRSVSR